MKKLFIFLLLGILLATPLISASDWDNILAYSNDDLKVTLKNSILWIIPTSEIGTAELKSHSSVDYVKEVGAGNQVVMWYDFNFEELYLNGLGDVEFRDVKTGKVIVRDYMFVRWGKKERNIYGDGKCVYTINGTKECEQIVIGKETYDDWLPYDSKDIPKGNVRIGLMTYVQVEDEIDGIWTITGRKISRHAEWTAELDVGLVAYWAMNEDSGTNVLDSVRAKHNGTAVNSPTWVSGKIGNALKFTSASSQEVKVLDHADLDITGTLTIAFWVNLTTVEGTGVDKGFDGSALPYRAMELDAVTENFGTYDGGWNVVTYKAFNTNSWNLVVTRWNGTYINVWVNNSHVGSVAFAGAIPTNNHNLTFGAYLDATPTHLDFLNGVLDEIGIWNRSLTDAEINQLWNDGDGISYEGALDITLILPENNASFATKAINFSANVLDVGAVGIQNVSFIIDGVINQTNTSGFEGFYNWTLDLNDGDYNWTVLAYDDGNEGYPIETRDFSIDTIPPTINITSPEGGIYHKSGNNLTLNWTAFDLNIDTCWYSYRGTNTTATCSDNSTNIFNVTNISAISLTFYVNDTAGNLASDTTTWFYHSWEYERTFNNITYETASETYTIKINTIDSITPTSPKFFHNDVEYTATATPLGGNNFSISKTIDLLTISSEVNKTLYFQWDVAVYEATSETSNQTIKVINFTRCFAGTTYLNFTFKDETDDSLLNASNDLTDTDYWLGDGSKTKSYITSNVTEDYDYAFCFSPPNRTITVDLIFKYSKSGYPLRTFTYDEQSLTNTTLNKILYLLSTTDGIYSSISVIESSGASIEGVVIQVERQFSGVWTLISQDTTGSDGVATFWVNPNFQHRLTATKTNYITTQVTITPSQTLYTLTMQRTTGEAEYDSDIPGLVYTSRPAVGPTVPGARNFNITIWSSEENLENCKFELINASNTSQVFDSDTSITNSSYCFININYNLEENTIMFGRLSVDTTETTGFVIIDTDLKWIGLAIDVKEWRTIKSFFADLITLSEFGEGEEAEFSRIVTFFLIATIIFGVIIYLSGGELTSPGIASILIWGIVLFASAGGFLTVDLGSPNVNTFIEQYAFSFLFTITMINYFLTTIRRAED